MRSSSRIAGAHLIALVALIGTIELHLPVTAEEPAKGDASAAPHDMPSLIAKVKENEDLFRNVDATVKSTWEFATDTGRKFSRGISLGPSVMKSMSTTSHMVTVDDRFFFAKGEEVSFTTGQKLPASQTIVFDGTTTVAIDEGNSATIFKSRHEPALMLPPHCWGIFSLEVNFPLSDYLQGTEAIKQNPKALWRPVVRGLVYQFSRVEAEYVGEEAVDDLDCVKVKVSRWYFTDSPPTIQYLWLAKARNYHVARCAVFSQRRGLEIPGDETHVAKWQEVDKGIWAPAEIETKAPSPEEGRKALPRPRRNRNLTIEKVTLNPQVPAELFKLPTIPESLPTFTVGPDNQLIDSPQHPHPATADPATTLDSIVTQLAAEEAKYDGLEAKTVETYAMLNRSDLSSGGTYQKSEARETSLFAGNRSFYTKEQGVKLAAGDKSGTVQRQAFDGKWVRGTYSRDSGKENEKKQFQASLSLEGAGEMQLVRAHAMVFRGDRNRQSVAQFLKSGWFDEVNKYKLAVEYVGDEEVGGLHCHKLKCDVIVGEDSDANNYFFIWLARDRNLIPVRHEWREPRWIGTLPTGINLVEDLREIRSGVWYPYRTSQLAFQKHSREGLSEHRPLLQWRRDIVVESLTLDPPVNEAMFTKVEVPAGTKVTVSDERGQFIGQYTQAEDGNLDVNPEQLVELKQKAQDNKEEAEARQKALDALVGQPAPELPKEKWLNSQPLSWKDMAGKVIVVDFWAVWCGPCQGDLDRLAEVHETWQKNSITNTALLGIHTAGSDVEKVTKAAADKKLGYPIIIDSQPKGDSSSWGELFERFAVGQIPMAIVVDSSGKIAAHGDLEEMLSKARQLAKEGEPNK